MTFANILAEVYRRGRYQATPATDVVTRIKAFVNEAQQELAADPRLRSLLRGALTFTTTASQAEYGLGPQMARLVVVRDTTNRWPLRRRSLPWYRATLPDQTNQSGTPTDYADLGPKPVTKQPASATGVWAVSSSAGDTTQTVYIEANRTGLYLHSATVTLNGTTRAQVGSQTDYVEILDFYLSAAAAGDVTLYDAAASGNILGVIPKGQTRATSQWIGLAPTPSAALTYSVDYEHAVTDLVNDTDEPAWLPTAFHRLLAIGARRREYEYQNDDRLATAATEWDVETLKLVAFVNNPPDAVLVPGAVHGVGRSDLGAEYPAGTIWN